MWCSVPVDGFCRTLFALRYLVLVCVVTLGCPGGVGAKKKGTTQKAVNHKHFSSKFRMVRIDKTIKEDPAIEALIRPYRQRLQKKMAEVLTHVRWGYTRRRPESTLGNLVADLCLARLRYAGIPADIFISNLSGIRNDLARGKITLGDVFEILPFENKIVVLKVKGALLLKMLQPIINKGGEPVAGIKLQIDRKKKRILHVMINGRPLKAQRTYYIGTSDYLSRTGWLSLHHKKKPWRSTNIMLRDAVVWGLRYNFTSLWTPIEGRIRFLHAKKTSTSKRKGAK